MFRGYKPALFLLEGLNSLCTTYFFYDFYFYTQEHFHFGARQNLVLAALQGCVYTFGSYFGGRFAQRTGYFNALRLGIALMVIAMISCSQAEASLGLTVLFFVLATIGQTMTWPPLEAMVSEGEPAVRLQGLVGIYNVVWAGAGALAYFTGGALLHWNLQCIFWVPASFLIAEWVLATWLQKRVSDEPLRPAAEHFPAVHATRETYGSSVPRPIFLRMAWLANPMAYLAINTVISTVPSLAVRMHFTPEMAGFVCSLWLFARALSFIAFRLWPGWHYRFRFLAFAYVIMVAAFGCMLLTSSIFVLLGAQIFFGIGIGLIYYSSLFYSMDAGDAKGEHGGIHEAAIGIGNATGPATAAASLFLFHEQHGSGTAAVCLLLAGGFAALLWLRFRSPLKS